MEGAQQQALELQQIPAEDHVRILVRGELDLATAPLLERAVAELQAGGGSEILVELDEVSFIDSTGIAKLIKLRHAGVRFQAVDGPVMRVLELTQMQELVERRDGRAV